MVDREAFGASLRVERERRGVTIKDIAASTKVKESLFAELERGDLSKWPRGVFRRAHFRAYLSAIGQPPQPALEEFLSLFPEEEPQPDERTQQALRGMPFVSRVWCVCWDLAVVCLLSNIVADITHLSFWIAGALVGLCYAAVGTMCLTQSVGTSIHQRIHAMVVPTRVKAGDP